MSKIFLDANILLDILIPDRPNHKKAVETYIDVCEKFDTIATSENILTTIEYIASRNKISCKTISAFFTKLTLTFELYPFSHILTKSLVYYEAKCKNSQKVDFEDLLQVNCAVHYECDAFLTEDKDIKKMGLNIAIMSLDDFERK